MTFFRALAAAATLLLAATAPAAAAADNTQARLWADSDNTRLVLESDSPLRYSVSDLPHPPRLILDLHSPTLNPAVLARLTLIAPPYLHGMRASRHSPNSVRVVFDIAQTINYRVSRLAPINQFRHRLVIDLTPQAPPDDPLLTLIEDLLQETPADAAQPFIVLIDPGHGGEDPGAVSPNNNYEKNVVLQISRKLAAELNRRPGIKALLTRDSDRFIPLYERVRIAHRIDAGAFVSIHADSVKSRRARGSSVFILSQKGASSNFARNMAKQANLSDLIAGQPATRDSFIDSALRRISQDGKDRASRQLARLMLTNLGNINKLHSKRVESAGFAVLKSPSIPSVLVETAFISNPEEEKKLHSKKFQNDLAQALANAIDTYRQKYR